MFDNDGAKADGDGVEWDIFIQEGTYEIWLLGQTGTDAPILDFVLNGTSLGTIDMYESSGKNHQRKMISSISISDKGAHTLQMKANGKNGSSSNYQIMVDMLQLIKVG